MNYTPNPSNLPPVVQKTPPAPKKAPLEYTLRDTLFAYFCIPVCFLFVKSNPLSSSAFGTPPPGSLRRRRGVPWGAGDGAGPLLPTTTHSRGPGSADPKVSVPGLSLAVCVAQEMATSSTSCPQFPHLSDGLGADAKLSKA